MQIPQQTHRFHLDWDDPRCDTLEMLNMAARRGFKYVDCNAVHSADGVSFNMHWAEGPRLNHYDWIATGKRRWGREVRRPMTEAELSRNVDHWHSSDIGRWRRVKRGGPRPATVFRRQRQAKRRALIVCWEIKTRDYGEADYAERMVADVERAGGRAFYMTLVTMRNWGPKLRAFKEAGAQTALLAHDAPEPSNLREWHPSYIDVVWGRFR